MMHSLQDRIQVPAWLADDYLDTYIVWREECDAVRDAYERWEGAGRSERPAAFAAYGAALDREEQAAHVLRSHVERVRRWRHA